MQIRPIREDRAFAANIFRRYKAMEGSKHIAGPTTLAYVSACLRVFRPRTVVECGAGIGTITDALLSHCVSVDRVISLEHDAFCIAALAANLGHHDMRRFTILTEPEQIADADMIIGDGGAGRREVFGAARSGTVIIVDGTRVKFREELQSALRRAA